MADAQARQHMKELMLDVLNFIGWHDLDDMQGGVTAEKAFDSFCILVGLPAGKMLNLVRGEPETAEIDDDCR